MPKLTKRQLYTYALVSQGVHGSEDILSGFLPFFEPLIADCHNQLFSPKHFADIVARTYGWPVSTDVIEELIPRFEKQGWLQQIPGQGARVAFICTATSASAPPPDDSAAHTLERIKNTLHEFVQDFSPLIKFDDTPDDLLESFLNWLISVEGFDRTSLLSVSKRLVSRDIKLGLNPSKTIFTDVSAVDSDDAFLSARYVQHLIKHDPDLLQRVLEIASLALLTEVILDFRTPPNAARQERGLSVFLDGPFAMDALSLSGRGRLENAKQILDGLRSMGCQVKVLSHSCDEIRDNLQGFLRRPPGQRFGPTAEALLRSELDEDYVRAVCGNTEHFVQHELGLQVLNWSMEQFPNEHIHFTSECYEDFLGTLHFHDNFAARERDAQSVAIIMRRRGGRQSRDPFSTRFFLVTRNHLLAQCAREFCMRRGLLRGHEEGPVITQRRLAALLWLTLSAQDREELTRRQLLVACERVSQVRPELIDGTMRKLKKVREADLPKLEALLTVPRSAQMLLDLTLNKQEVITEDNIEQILDMMQKATAEELRNQQKRETKEIKKLAQAEIEREKELRQRVERSLAGKELDLSAARGQLDENEGRDIDMMRRLAEEAASFASLLTRGQQGVLVVLAVLLAMAGWMLNTGAMPEYASILAWILAALTLFFAIGPLFPGFPNVLRPWVSRARDNRLKRKMEAVGRTDLLESYHIDWDNVQVQRRG